MLGVEADPGVDADVVVIQVILELDHLLLP